MGEDVLTIEVTPENINELASVDIGEENQQKIRAIRLRQEKYFHESEIERINTELATLEG